MANYIRCRACGYVMDEMHLKDLCPACGLPKTVFEADKRKISAQRRFILAQHLHPVAIHFPQVLLMTAAFLPVLSMLVADPLRYELFVIAKWSVLCLPFAVLLGLVTGLLDGKIRFKKLTTPLLMKKILAGVVLQILTCAAFLVYFIYGFAGSALWVIVLLNLLALPLSVYLGRAGAGMVDSLIAG